MVASQLQERSPRLRTLKGGKITFNNHGSVIDCTVRNLSDTGACLQVHSPIGIPDEFNLVLDSGRKSRPCRVAWRSPTQIGVAFLG